MKRIIGLLLILGLCLCGCGSQSPEAEQKYKERCVYQSFNDLTNDDWTDDEEFVLVEGIVADSGESNGDSCIFLDVNGEENQDEYIVVLTTEKIKKGTRLDVWGEVTAYMLSEPKNAEKFTKPVITAKYIDEVE